MCMRVFGGACSRALLCIGSAKQNQLAIHNREIDVLLPLCIHHDREIPLLADHYYFRKV